MVKRLSTLLLLCATLPVTLLAATPQGVPPAPAYGGGPGPMGPGGQHPQSMMAVPFAGVQFSEEQRQRIDTMMNSEREAHQKRIERMQQAQARLQQLYQADIWDEKAIIAAYDEIFAEQRKTVEAMTKSRNEVYKMLSKEQREQMKQFELQMRRFGPGPRQ